MKKTPVFISYSHHDQQIKDRLLSHMRVFQDSNIMTFSSDEQISAGVQWKDKIIEELNKADMVVLLVSADFLSSDFILNVEIPAVLDRREHEGLVVVPIIAKPCAWQRVDWLRRLQVLPKSGRPLLEGTDNEIEQNFAEVAEQIVDMGEIVGKPRPKQISKTVSKRKRTGRKRKVDVFICHDHDDGDFAELLKLRIQEAGYTAWIDLDRLNVGEDWRKEIDEAIRDSIALVTIMTPSARNSEYVTYEWAFAWGTGVKVIPIMLKETQLHPRLEALQYLDFTNRAARPWPQLIDALNNQKVDKER